MKITAIRPQVKRSNRFSIFIDSKYAFSLSDSALIETKLAPNQDIDDKTLKQLKDLSGQDLTYNKVLRFVAMRPRSRWEIEQYLERHKIEELTAKNILAKLAGAGLINDEDYAASYVRDHQGLRGQSKRKMEVGLKQKRVSADIINKVLNTATADEIKALQQTILKKRRQTKYQDDLKLMQYLARQGFSYSDIKEQLAR